MWHCWHFEPACFKQGPNRHFIPSGKAVRDLAGAETYLVWVTRGWGAVAATEIAVLVRRELTLIRDMYYAKSCMLSLLASNPTPTGISHPVAKLHGT